MKSSDKIKKTFACPAGGIASVFSGPEQDSTFKGIEDEYQSDVDNRRARRAQFERRFQRVDRIPLVGSIGKGLFAEGGLNLGLLFAIFIMFTAIKAHYFGLALSGDHSTQYKQD